MPIIIDVTMFKPICIPNEIPTLLIIKISIPPKIELKTNFKTLNSFILKIIPIIIIANTHPEIVAKLFTSKIIPPFNRYVLSWTNITSSLFVFLIHLSYLKKTLFLLLPLSNNLV